jgi:hypothetical protein
MRALRASPPAASAAPPASRAFAFVLALALLARHALAQGAAAAAASTPSPTPRPAVCTLSIYNAVWDREMRYSGIPPTSGCLSVDRVTTFPRVADNATGLLEQWCAEDAFHSVACKAQIERVTYQPFGPPSAFEVMNVVCKGACMSYYNRYKRLQHSEYISGCTCKAAGKVQCPKHPLDILFTVTGLSYDPDFYWESTCQPYACGRYKQDEASYRAERKACSLNFDGAAAARPAAAALALAALAGVAALRLDWL